MSDLRVQPAPARTRAEMAAARDSARRCKDDIVRRYRDGEPVTRIAGAYRVSANWLTLRLDAWGVPRRPRCEAHLYRRAPAHVFKGRSLGRRSGDEVRAAQARFARNRVRVTLRYLDGEPVRSLAREFQVSPTWVAERFDEWRVPRRGSRVATPPRRGAGGSGSSFAAPGTE